MSKHAWIQEHLAAFIAGGLDAEEADRLTQHVASCPACAKSLDEVRTADRSLAALFAGVLPDVGVEDRLIQRLRNTKPRSWNYLRPTARLAAAAAAVLMLGFIGAVINLAIDNKELSFSYDGPKFKQRLDESLAKIAIASWNTDSSEKGRESGVESKRRNPEALDATPHRDPIVPLPLGHDGTENGRSYKDGETTYFEGGVSGSQSAQTAGKRVQAQVDGVRGILDHDGRITADLNGLPALAQGSGAPSQSASGGFLSNFDQKNLVSGITPKGNLTQDLGAPIPAWSVVASLQNSDLTDPFPPELEKSLGYHPPSRALVVKESSRLDPKIGRGPSGTGTTGTNVAPIWSTPPLEWHRPSGLGTTGTNVAPSEVMLLADKQKYFKPTEVAFGESDRRKERLGRKDFSDSSNGSATPLSANPGFNSNASPNLPALGVNPLASPGVVVRSIGYLGRSSPEEVAKAAKVDSSLGDPQTGPAKPSATQPPAQPATPRKVIIRTGEVEFEVESFDAATVIIAKLVNAIPGGFIATTNSEKLPNGKVRGAVVVRTPPEHLDDLVLGLRKELAKGGELKSQRIGSQDITKQFTDLESRLRAARTMEERLLQIIKAGKGEIKDLLNVEKELAVWRTKIEEMEGELRFFAHQVALSTLTITLAEKEIRAPDGVLETERINMGIETEDVEKAQAQTLAIVADVKGRITKSELKQLDAGQFNAVINFEVPPDAAGPVRDRLKQLGNLARFDVNRVMEAEGGTGKPQDGKLTRKDAQFFLSLYNLANVAPREVTNFDVATLDAEAAYKAVLARVQKLGGRVVTSNLNRQNNDQTVGTISFQVKAAEADAIVAELKAIGETLRHQTTENPDSQNTTRSKRGFLLQILAFGAVPARETTTLQLATPDVVGSYRKLQETITAAKGRMLSAQLNEQNRQNTTGVLDFEVLRAEEPVLRAAIASLGDVLSRNVTRVPENENAISGKVHLQVALIDAARIPPRETTTLEIEPPDVDAAATLFTSIVREKGGRTVESHVSRERNGRASSKLVFNVPLAAAAEVVDGFKASGIVRVQDKTRNPQVPDGSLAVARIEVTLSNSDLIVPSDQGLWPQVRKGLSTSFVGLSWSLTVVIIGILFVLPWVLAIYVGFRVVRWMRGAPRSV